jgi:hypothetical protein
MRFFQARVFLVRLRAFWFLRGTIGTSELVHRLGDVTALIEQASEFPETPVDLFVNKCFTVFVSDRHLLSKSG